eukprot:CAMPEP_0183418606 /NCGR_PEP_ID=MMETSP0370-20130417/25223_1 /TAXON_ID=268820 /ORGANISM="Peridinium aciculiferum, Strain PAER-2" /LENGTH=232 /DNA_ID=CAMNT_0025602321 /DNA_START=36 /DNA_END=731 /DNA_ORIENTATION=-
MSGFASGLGYMPPARTDMLVLRACEEWQSEYNTEHEELQRAITLGEEWQERSALLEEQLQSDSELWEERTFVVEEQMAEASRVQQAENYAELLASQQDGQAWQQRSEILEDQLESVSQLHADQTNALEDTKLELEQYQRRAEHLEDQLESQVRQEEAEIMCFDSEREALRQRSLLLEVRLQRAEGERQQNAEAAEELLQERSALHKAEHSVQAWHSQTLHLQDQLRQVTEER